MWVWAVLLLVLGMGLAIMEVFFPSAGILGFLAASAVVAAVVLGFQYGTGTGFAILAVAVFGDSGGVDPGVPLLAAHGDGPEGAADGARPATTCCPTIRPCGT